jgi:hypothetical protein
MTWDEVRNQYPHSWVIVEAVNAYTENGKRIISELRLVEPFNDDWHDAWEYYKQIHDKDKYREYYVLHTDRQVLDIGVIDAFGHILG